jgi:phosphonoacetaldehyde hydrolase
MARDIGLVVFDWAGTVIDFGCCAPAGAFVRAFAEAGISASMAEARAPMGLHKKDHIRAMLAARGTAWTERDVESLYERVTPLQVAAAKAHSALVPEVLDCVKELRAMSVKIAGTTGYFREAAEACYTAGIVQGYLPDFRICADEVPAGRPAPWMIYRCMEALDVYPPRRVVKVGDTLVDVADGLNAGVWSVAVVQSSNEMGLSVDEFTGLDESERVSRSSEVRRKFEAAGADFVIDTLAELPEVVRELNRRLTDSL